MLWLSRRPEWQRSREFETTTRTSGPGGSNPADEEWDQWDIDDAAAGEDGEGRPKTRIVFQPTADTTHTIYYRGHWLRVKRGRKQETGCEMLSISVVARSNTILKQLVLQAKKEYEAEAVHRIQIYFADSHGSWRWTDSRHKRPMASIVLNPGVKEMLLDDTNDFLKSEKWYADRGIPFRRGYLLHGVPGSGKSSLIHALAGQLQLDIYVVSLSASWISDSTLTTLMGRVPARCVVLLEDLDAAFVRSVSRDDDDQEEEKKEGPQQQNQEGGSGGSGGSGRRRRGRGGEQMSDVNTLSLSGLLNALDGVAAAEGRLLFATTNHLERLDPALSRPGRMDVWIEFKNASKWQAEALFRNFFPCAEEEEEADEQQLKSINVDIEVEPSSPPSTPRKFVPMPSNSASTPTSLWSLSSSLASSASSLLASPPMSPSPLGSGSGTNTPPPPRTQVGTPSSNSTSSSSTLVAAAPIDKNQFGATNTAYLPPPPTASVLNTKHSAAPLDTRTLAILAKRFADGVPEEEFSVAALQGCESPFLLVFVVCGLGHMLIFLFSFFRPVEV
jgi:chaperone BCS1